MSIDQLQRFVLESIELGWHWDVITLLGGEPTLHPQFSKLFEVLARYREFAPACDFRLYTNGFGPAVNNALACVPPWVRVGNSEKSPTVPPLFSAYNLAPVDFPDDADEDFSRGCSITKICGVGLTRYGYYPCGAGASVDRVFGLDIGIKKLENVTPEAMVNQLKTLCSLCGHFRDFDNGFLVQIQKPGSQSDWIRESAISPRWAAAYMAYKESPPQLTKY
jgi:hypothetical protein